MPAKRTQILLDLLVFTGAFALCQLLRFEFEAARLAAGGELAQMFYVIPLQLVILRAVGGHKFIWRYVGMPEIKAFAYAALICGLVLAALRIALPQDLRPLGVPPSLIIMDACFAFGGALLLRVASRAVSERNGRARGGEKENKQPTLLIGAGQAGRMVAGELRAQPDTGLEIRGFIDDDRKKQGARIHGLDVLGTTADLPRLARELKIVHAIITIGRTSREETRRIIEICEQIPVHVSIIPPLHEIMQGKAGVSHFREIRIEDLLDRDLSEPDEEIVGQCLTGKRIMVTGAGGSIGAELVRQIARFHPAKLLLVERSEFGLFNVHREMQGDNGHPAATFVPLLADINHRERMRAVFDEHRPHVVLHAAAHKHVPLGESNVAEMVRNNVLATNLVGEMAGEYGVETFVLISTDKAVNPTSVMGATKRVAELVVQNLNRRFGGTRYLAVRFGNVIGSTGSVVPIFQEQIRRGGPVTVTDERMARYFMTIPEAALLVLQAGGMGRGGEIFSLRMAPPVRIYDLARDMIARCGLKPGADIEIKIVGARPGEKLHEELEPEESHDRTRHPRILVGRLPAYPPEAVSRALERLEGLVARGDCQEIRGYLNSLLPEARLGATAPQKSAASSG